MCQELITEQNYDKLCEHIENLLEYQGELENELNAKQEQLQDSQLQIEQLEKEDNMLQEYITEQIDHLEKEKLLLQQIDQEIQNQKNREIQLQIERTHICEQEQIYENQKENFMNLFNQCHTYHDENQELATKISDLEIENEYLEKDCDKLEQQVDQQQKYINCLKQLNIKTEETLQRLTLYQEELKMLLHLGPSEQVPKFDPIQYIKSVSTAHQEDLAEIEDEAESFLEDIQLINLKKQNTKSNHLKYIGLFALTVIGIYVTRKKLV